MQYVTVGRVREQRKKWWQEMMMWFDIGVMTVGLFAILLIGYHLIAWAVR